MEKIRKLWKRLRSGDPSTRNRGQTLAIFAIAFLSLAVTLGLAIDVGALYVQYDHLRRGVDAAAL